MLGIETSGERGSVALLREDELLAEHRFAQGYRHARNIMAGVADVVRSAGVDRGEIDAVGVTDGPGSFTGLRVGVTCAKTLAWLLGLPAVGVPTLDVLAQNVRPEEHLDARGRPVRTVCPLLDARRGFVYGAV
ncbi:MAG: tRNA (adenosine(37)-N6)-threonylcarbamoyltransferase complex dimerization subunit type 1 TsaB, partial [Candidatus Brocadiia bacterium]|nr:tRNA (adenosine(37)-N6)-threonylcarbamoyltransferase complex dimerization subunit type 1 TsaB [Candidatus Brocadiia bacterium]